MFMRTDFGGRTEVVPSSSWLDVVLCASVRSEKAQGIVIASMLQDVAWTLIMSVHGVVDEDIVVALKRSSFSYFISKSLLIVQQK